MPLFCILFIFKVCNISDACGLSLSTESVCHMWYISLTSAFTQQSELHLLFICHFAKFATKQSFSCLPGNKHNILCRYFFVAWTTNWISLCTLQALIFWVVDNYLKETYSVTPPLLKVSQRSGAVSAEPLVTGGGDREMKPVQLKPFSGLRSGYSVISTTNPESDSDRLLALDDDPGFNTDTFAHAIRGQDGLLTASSNTTA